MASWSRESFPDFEGDRAAALQILQAEERLQEQVRLVGRDALPDADSATLLVARMLREDFLCQNIFTPYDRHCPFYKTALMLRLLIHFHENCQAAIANATFARIKSSCAELMYAMSTLKFEDPVDGEEAFRRRFAETMARIDDEFSRF
jgi:V-type H+-transporting ATPase subunit A